MPIIQQMESLFFPKKKKKLIWIFSYTIQKLTHTQAHKKI